MEATSASGIMLISCPDRKGIVATVAGLLFSHGANIIDLRQHSDTSEGVFFMRVEFELAGMSLAREEIPAAFEPIAQQFAMDWWLRASDQVKAMAIMVSRHEHCLVDLLLRQRSGELKVRLPAIVSNHETLRPIAEAYGVPYHYFPVTPKRKPEQEAAVLALFEKLGIDFVVLARYMQVLSPAFVDRYRNRIINIHHSFLPAFAGARPYQSAYERGVKIIGATSHYVTEDLDEGPIIEQDTIRVSHRDSVQDMVRKGRDLERMVLARAVRAHAEDRILAYGRRTVVFD